MNHKITLLIAFLLITQGFAQKRVADKFYDTYAYKKAAELYQIAVKRGDSSTYTLTRLGDCYYNNANTIQAEFWYKLAIEKDANVSKEHIYKYIQALRSLGKYKEAEKWVAKLNSAASNETLEFYEEAKSLPKDSIQVINLDLNTKNSDFGPYVSGQHFYFSSAMNEKGEQYLWNNQPYLDLYQAKLKKEKDKTDIENVMPVVSTKINTNFHEASIAITKDGKTMYFTRNNLDKRNNLDYDKKGTSHLKIFKATLVNGVWDNVEELPFNDEVFSNGHPALSPDEKTLFFTSNRPGGFGETDLYKVTINENGTYGTPTNLGADINTPKREMFPYMDDNFTLYFSSDGYQNLGLLDIYKTDKYKNNNNEVINLGTPFNSGDDDFGFFKNKDNTGYFSSNRPKGKGDDDIYRFEPYYCKQKVQGKTYDAKTKEILALVQVKLINASGKVLDSVLSQSDGTYEFTIDCKATYTLRATKNDYKDTLAKITSTNKNEDVIEQDLYLTPLVIEQEIVINPIYFDFDKWNIRPDAAYELENIVDVMRNNSKMVIKIEAHTDSRGEDVYNETLSDKRAKSTRDYILSRSINSNRITSAIGYGESRLVNKCSNNVKCTEEEHQQNRRSKFIILQK